MTALTRALILIVIAGAGLSIYFFFFYVPQPVQAFDAILSLTPGDLELHCGIPAEDTMGVVADGAGIRDLHYTASGNSEIVFRFISSDDKQWESLGAWEKVKAPDFLGSPVDAEDVGRAMGCAAKEGSQSLLTPGGGQPGAAGLAPELAFVSPQAIPEVMMQTQHQSAPPMPTTTFPKGAAAQPAHSAAPVVRVPESDWSQAPKAYSWNNYDDDDLPRFRSLPSCPAGTGSCKMLDYSEFVEAMKQAIMAERRGEFRSAADRLSQHGVIVVQLPKNEQNRVEAIKNVVRLEVKSFNVIEERLREDVTRLEPARGDTADKAAKKIAEMRREDNLRRVLWSHAVEANGTARALSAKGDMMRFNDRAYQRMVEIATSGEWR